MTYSDRDGCVEINVATETMGKNGNVLKKGKKWMGDWKMVELGRKWKLYMVGDKVREGENVGMI